jgi:hypothetical protein
MVYEDGEWWCHGVSPGGLTECGETPALAWAGFKESLGGIFEDLAGDSSSVDAFRQVAQRFVLDANRPQAERWSVARLAIRAGSNAIEAPFDALARNVDEIEPSVTVELLEHIVAEQNYVELAAAA